MIDKKQSLSTSKIVGLAVLLGFFGLFGISSVSAQSTNPCRAATASITDGSKAAHPYTCQQTNNVGDSLCGNDGSISQKFSNLSCNSSILVCHRCVCPSGTTWSGNKCEAPVVKADGYGLIGCGTGATKAADGTCTCNGATIAEGVECKATPISTPSVTCGANEEPNSLNQCVCKAGFKKPNEGGECVSCNAPGVCCGIKLNTNVPFVGKCIRTDNTNADGNQTTTTATTAFPKLMGALTKIMTTVILLICFGGILAGGVMIASSGGDSKRAGSGKELIKNVVFAIALLGASGIILHLINPNFFG